MFDDLLRERAKQNRQVDKRFNNLQLFGIYEQSDNAEHRIYDCPFCGRESKLYINKLSWRWDCKVCGKAGGFYEFLTYIHTEMLKTTESAKIKELAEYRAIPIEGFRGWQVAFFNDNYWLPVYNFKGKIIDLRHAKLRSKIQSLGGVKTGIFGLKYLMDKARTKERLYICGGEYDCVSLNWLLKKCGRSGVVISVPGENVFKKEWVTLVRDRVVVLCYDNDGAGEQGKIKVRGMLLSTNKQILHVDWPIEYPSNYDINDFISSYAVRSENPNKGLELFDRLVKPLFPSSSQDRKHKVLIKEVKEKLQEEEINPVVEISESGNLKFNKYKMPSTKKGKGKSAATTKKVVVVEEEEVEQDEALYNFQKELEEEWDKIDFDFPYLLSEYKRLLDLNPNLEDTIKVCLATALSIRQPGQDPLWMFIVGPPGFGKTAILSSFKTSEGCYFQSSLRPRQLVSGFKSQQGIDPSLIPKLDGKCLILKDYTEVLEKNRNDRDEIFSILRGAYDGYVEREFGNDVIRRYNTRFAILAGVTNLIKIHSQASLGERFLKFAISAEGIDLDKQQEAALKQAIANDQERHRLQHAVRYFLSKSVDMDSEAANKYLNKEFRKKLIALSRILAQLRSTVTRFEHGSYMKRDTPAYRPEVESGNRVSIQLQRLAIGLCTVLGKDKIDGEIYRLLVKTAFDTVESYPTQILRAMFKGMKAGQPPQQCTRTWICDTIQHPFQSIKLYLEDLIMLGTIERGPDIISQTNRKTVFTYIVARKMYELWLKAGLFGMEI